jgi:hypothetical protein
VTNLLILLSVLGGRSNFILIMERICLGYKEVIHL